MDRDDADPAADDRAAHDEVDDAARERQHERAETVESQLAAVRADLGNQQYPVSSEDLATTYADQRLDLPDETESLGSVFDRIDDTFESADTAYAALVSEIEQGRNLDAETLAAGASPAVFESDRATTQHEGRLEGADSRLERAKRRASEAQGEKADAERGTDDEAGRGADADAERRSDGDDERGADDESRT